jgi:protein N-terminal methyltransferase
MLGGFERVTRVDLLGSRTFFAKLRLPRPAAPPYRIADCGAGIGRITKGFLTKINADVVVDVVEPVKKFTDQVHEGVDWDEEGRGKIGEIINEGLETWTPEKGRYWVIWNQWCLGHLKDVQFVEYLRRCKEGLVEGGLVVVKENVTTSVEDEFDELDSSVTR